MNPLHTVHVLYRYWRRRFHRHQVRAQRRRIQNLLAIRVGDRPRFDERSTIDRFRRESGQL